MGLAAFVALVRKDLQLFFSDRRAVILTFAVPIAIASFFGSIFRGAGDNDEPAKIAVAIVDRDGSAISKSILAGIRADRSLDTSTPGVDVRRCGVVMWPSRWSCHRALAMPPVARFCRRARSRRLICSSIRHAAQSWRWCAAC